MYNRHRLLLQSSLFLASVYVCVASRVAEDYSPVTAILHLRAACPANTYQCPASLGAIFNDICCQNGQTCALDTNSNPACCPSGAVCTGTAPTNTAHSTPSTATSYVPNSYFSFPYAPMTFPNSASCASAIQACSHNYDACITGLSGGSAFPVTIDVPGGKGVTVGATKAGLGGAQATSICSSLSSEACSSLTPTKCDSYGQNSAAPTRHSIPLLLLASITGTNLVVMLMSYQT
ncbi:hypothetical protein PT974_11841 [Cladobotryum mycophilum]|uniref:Gpi-anchored protein n=1 Tax=Cladobotryum mycophilum TaxID=491253 RepID=A0ABR0S6Y3_9HYPO